MSDADALADRVLEAARLQSARVIRGAWQLVGLGAAIFAGSLVVLWHGSRVPWLYVAAAIFSGAAVVNGVATARRVAARLELIERSMRAYFAHDHGAFHG